MRSDTTAVIYLQKAKDARRRYATLVHSKNNCDGFTQEGITYPSTEKQTLLLKEFYEECGISPAELSYMEAHATGTIVGDPVEVTAIDQALCSKREATLLMGSVKSNLGHSEGASGFCQIAKVLLAMESGIITPTIHFKQPRKNLTAILEGRIKVVTELTKWKGGYVGINSFGFGGGNCHILLKSNPKQKVNNGAPNDDLPRLVIVSGRTEEAVKVILDDVRCRPIDAEYITLLHHIHSHVVNEKNLFPAAGYLYFIWQMIASLKKQEYLSTPVVFEDVNFIRAVVLSQQNETNLTLVIQEGSNRFEIIEGDNTVVTGIVRIATNIEDEKISVDHFAECVNEKEEMTTKDIYKELKLRGYQYTGIFRGLISASTMGLNGHIAWACNWVTFMDSMLQIMILGQNSRNLLVPTRIRKLIIDPKYHIQLIENCPIEER
ncbi:PREDICTED: fatty acid synthase-like, partial [Vollenhovia emeryi]|uniref:fatty acid synthase-like n=1 Tax=Vollenhovia emeryi TaxID=411798 RepID=UPI0005F50ADF